MSLPEPDFRQSLVAAVQAELERHASAVVAEVERLREQTVQERIELRAELTEQLRQLTESVDELRGKHDADSERLRVTLEQRVVESESRQTRRLDESTAGIETIVAAAARPLLAEVATDHETMGTKLDHLESQLRKFDEQAARMVTYFNDMTKRMDAKQDELAQVVATDVAGQVATIRQLVDDNDSSVRRFQNDVGQMVSTRLGDVEDRVTTKLLAAESRMKEDAGQRIADIDAHVGRVSTSLDETMTVLNDRIAAIDDRFVDNDRRVGAVEASIRGIDQDALDELKAKMSAAVGEAMLVRIEMERFEQTANDRADDLAVRVTEVETQLADATMDVSTAVQLERLEEIERSLLLLDPTKFVLKDGARLDPAFDPPSPDDLGEAFDGASHEFSLNLQARLADTSIGADSRPG